MHKKNFTIEVGSAKTIFSKTLSGLEKKVDKLRKKSKYKQINILYIAKIIEHSIIEEI